MGVVLIALGIIAALWIVERVFALGGGPENIELIARFASLDDAGGRVMRTPSGDVEFPHGWYMVAGTFLYLLAMAIVAGLAKALIVSGARLLSHDVATLVEGLRNDIGGLRKYVETKAGEIRER